MANRHRIDLLSDVRAEIKVLKQREETLRAEILADPTNLSGDEHEAQLCVIRTERLDVELMRQELGMLFLRPFFREQSQVRVQLKPRPKKTRR